MASCEQIRYIVKRDGRRTSFDSTKISNAIKKAFQATQQPQTQEYIDHLSDEVVKQILSKGIQDPGVETIQDIVESTLIENGHVRTARNYIAYRAERTRVRETQTRLMRTFADITYKDSKNSDVKREMQMLMAIQLWDKCSNMGLRALKNFSINSCSNRNTHALILTAISIFMI